MRKDVRTVSHVPIVDVESVINPHISRIDLEAYTINIVTMDAPDESFLIVRSKGQTVLNIVLSPDDLYQLGVACLTHLTSKTE